MNHRFYMFLLAGFVLYTSPLVNQVASAESQTEAAYVPGERALTFFYQGQVLSRDNKFDAAVDAYLQAIALEPAYHQARLSLAILYGKNKKYKEALQEIAYIQKKDPKNYLSYKVQGLILQDNKQRQEAAIAFENYLKLVPAKQVKDAEEIVQLIAKLKKAG